jgi:rare lipoprotein A
MVMDRNPSGFLFMKTCIKTLRCLIAATAILLSAPSEATARERGAASWYGSNHHGKLMANGQPFNQWALTAAHRTLPLGTRIHVRNLANDTSVIVTITDRGPYIRGRILDVSRGTADRLQMTERGIARVEITTIHRPRRRN